MSADRLPPTRRQLLAGLAGAAGLVVAGTLVGPGRAVAVAVARGVPFAEPDVLTASDGLLEVTLRAAPVDLPWQGTGTRYALAYNGVVPGPTLRVRPGDRLVVHLENGLDHATNLHTHGLHVSPAADDVFVAIAPGEVRTYVYDVPADHRPGLYWYHPHQHPWSAHDVGAGLSGLLVVDEADPAVLPPELGGASERLLLLSDPAVGPSAAALEATVQQRMVGREGDVVLVNGTRMPRLDAVAGTLERWRVCNASPSRYYRLALDDHRLVRIGSDQGLFTEPESRREVLLAPAERAELLVAPTRAGRYRLRALPYDRGRPEGMARTGGGRHDRGAVLATLAVTGDAPPAALPTTLPGRPPTVSDPDRTRLVNLAMAMVPAEATPDVPQHHGGVGDTFTINGKTYDPERIDVAPPLGTTQEWVIRNATTMDHPIHVHTWPFIVVRRSDDVPLEPGWKDTVNVPGGTEVRIRIPFVDVTGKSLYHCHILDHGDLGMMATIEVR